MASMTAETAEGQRVQQTELDEISPEVYSRFLQRHEGVLRDEATMLGFKAAIEANSELFRGATVLELGCGSALISMWVAHQGAARVYAVESSDVCQVARQLVQQNRLDQVIDVLHGPLQQLQLPPIDVIVSKWMGACLMYSSTLEDVLYARDKWLKPNGCIFPDIANLYMTAVEQPRHPLDLIISPRQYWARFAGSLNLSLAWHIALHTPVVRVVDANHVPCQRQLLQRFDLLTLQPDELSFKVPFKLRTLRQALAKHFLLYFDYRFPDSTIVSTSPSAAVTQWKQTLFPIDDHLPLCPGDVICGQFEVRRCARHLDFDISWSCHNELVNVKTHTQIYRMQGEPDPI
ncbi:protein arginine N-methyltransferase 1-like [Drosophila sulfurigaster albostrigata]|uniref:protein arginine N-methyltransferase 1-like n=1 Tax=Drosophila sulfurigaster albostrigata TaxID=89887 RepID=UPI002D21C11D|nr:protein arginine N-methyltransferase 1-like [Drosophila sulfurigaster albostrigata]